MDTFKYLVRIISFDNINWPIVARNYHIDQNKWGRFSRMFYQEVGDTSTSGRFYLVMVKSMLLFGS